ncbi:hypothetical protein [Rhizobium phaseoli]|uniref:hypothetical protein n=1 Tax=Rhizobium phaseoli TaxID=396 RepID=UPI0025520E47|nr:hypothetical protein [Rhizobium phaseoli]MDK4725658.1 hypothetical protein [Rhizobium phaseoli]
MSTMIERVARALDPYAWSEKGFSIRREVSKQQARAAIAEMREATPAMVEVGTEARWRSAVRDANSINEIWNVMIDAALKEEA